MRAPLIAAALLALAAAGCETFRPATCDRTAEGNPEVEYTDGKTHGDVYSSLPDDGQLLYFPGGMHYRLKHGLGRAPDWVELDLSFERYGTQDGGTLAQAAGNQAVITGLDAEFIHVANDSCVEYWLLVTAGAGAAP